MLPKISNGYNKYFNPFQIVAQSNWPFLVSIMLFNYVLSLIHYVTFFITPTILVSCVYLMLFLFGYLITFQWRFCFGALLAARSSIPKFTLLLESPLLLCKKKDTRNPILDHLVPICVVDGDKRVELEKQIMDHKKNLPIRIIRGIERTPENEAFFHELFGDRYRLYWSLEEVPDSYWMEQGWSLNAHGEWYKPGWVFDPIQGDWVPDGKPDGDQKK